MACPIPLGGHNQRKSSTVHILPSSTNEGTDDAPFTLLSLFKYQYSEHTESEHKCKCATLIKLIQTEENEINMKVKLYMLVCTVDKTCGMADNVQQKL